MVEWKFNAENVKETSFELIPVGDYRIRIEKAESVTSSGGNPMIKLEYAVSGMKRKLFHNLVLTQEYGDSKLKSLWDSFDIPIGTLDEQLWIGCVGACRTKQTHSAQYGDKTEVAYFIDRKRQDKLPAWVEVGEGAVPAPNSNDVPFDINDIL